jgi:8-oxo-dGTP diphosphatase/putative hydrolase of the HAD superfamily
MNKIKWLFFDLGSTLIDETECYKFRCDYIIRKNDIERHVFTDKVLELAKEKAYPIQAAAKYFGFEIPKWPQELEKLYPDAKNVLEVLSPKYKLGIIANQNAGTQERIDNWEIGKYFDVVIASAEEGCAKPDLKLFKIALNRANCKPGDAIMIGDRLDNDITPAKQIGMNTIWVRQGFAKYKNILAEDEKPDYMIETIKDVLEIISVSGS